jgi:hypothetical protein
MPEMLRREIIGGAGAAAAAVAYRAVASSPVPLGAGGSPTDGDSHNMDETFEVVETVEQFNDHIPDSLPAYVLIWETQQIGLITENGNRRKPSLGSEENPVKAFVEALNGKNPVVAQSDYEIQVDGQDGEGIINFKTES